MAEEPYTYEFDELMLMSLGLQENKTGKTMDPNNPQSCERWIKDEEMVHRTETYGENKRSVYDALEDQGHRSRVVKEFYKTVSKVKGQNKENVQVSYDTLKVLSEKRLDCLEDISQIAGLEDLLGALSAEFAEKASSLVAKECSKEIKMPDGSAEGIQAASQNCILAVKQNWSWISKLVRCTDTHLSHSSQYHQFYHEIVEYQHWMALQIRTAQEKVKLPENPKGDNEEAHAMLINLKELIAIYLSWQSKLENLFERSKSIIPVHLRTKKLDYVRPVSSLCDYKTNDISLREGEEILLLDNSDSQNWKVRNMNSVESKVPSVICVIPGPDPSAVQTTIKLRLELLFYWTENVKILGKDLILFVILILRDWNEEEIKVLKAMSNDEKDKLRMSMGEIVAALAPHWEEFKGFVEMKKRVENTRKILSDKGNDDDKDEAYTRALLDRSGAVEEAVTVYVDLWKHWDSFRLLMETCKHADYILLCEKLHQMQFISIEDLRKLWQAGLFGDGDNESFESWLISMRKRWEEEGGFGKYGKGNKNGVDDTDGNLIEAQIVQQEEAISCESVGSLGAMNNGLSVPSSTTMERKYSTATTEQISHAEQEEKKTFVITGVVNPQDDKIVSMHQAVMLGIINSANGTYNNKSTGESMPIPVAMSQGLIKVEFTTTKKSEEKRHDIGLITLKTHKESRPYTVKAVVDATTDEHLTVDDAIKRGILDQSNGIYINPRDKAHMSLADALDSGLLIVEFDTEAVVAEPEVVEKTYAIHAVVDQRKRAKITFSEAIQGGLLDKETGSYYHNLDKENIFVGDAIRRGFIKATVVKDPGSLDIDPENKLVVEKVQKIKTKLLNPMRALAAMKKAAANGK